MRNYLLLLSLCLGLSMTAQEVQLSWNKDLNVATELAKTQNKPILVYFTKTDCDACSHFYTAFFKQEAFKKLSNNFVLLMLDGSNNDINNTDISVIRQRRLVMHYNKSSTFPALLTLDSDRQETGELFSSTDEASISNYLNFLETLN
jgi:thioredoxin-related protein